jgi:tetratricopeptide (TPR) repeat protein
MVVTRHVRWPMLLGLLGLLPGAGCTPMTTLPALPTHSDPAALGKAPPLPPRKTAEVCLSVGESLEKAGHDVEAIGQYEKARQENPSLHLERRLAVLYDKVGDHQKAMAEFDKALKQSPRDPGLLNNVGYSYYNQRKFDEAEQYLRQALKYDANHALATRNLALTLAQKGQYEESLKLYARVDGQATACSNVAFVLTAHGKTEEAKQMYREALKCDPGLAIAKLALDRLENPGKASAEKKTAAGRAAPREPEGPAPRMETPDLSPVVVDPAQRRKAAMNP